MRKPRSTNAKAQLQIAKDRVGYTTLKADGAGTVTARGAEPGEVVQAGQMIVRMARQGGLDAVFDVPAQVLRAAPAGSQISVRLADDPTRDGDRAGQGSSAASRPRDADIRGQGCTQPAPGGDAARRHRHRQRDA